uniref:Aromatic-L-amino-acid decarboxylase n=1 Tax=Macrostomum lignano TaxID=282301 RepID=A0A1I8G246_9PLAT
TLSGNSAKTPNRPTAAMDVEEFRKHGKDMVDYICDYMKSLQERQVIPDVQPGYLRLSLPAIPPEQPEAWESIMKDVEDHVMRGVTHWQHPRFHAYFPAGNAYPSIMGGMLGDALGIVGFSWAASPACAELEMLVLDWLAKMTHMPHHFQHESGLGGGVMQGSASDSILVTMLAARRDKLNQIKREHANDFEEGKFLSRLVAYCSKLAHSCVEKAGMISCIQVHQLDYHPDDLGLQGRTLQLAIEEDRRNGLIPFFVCAVLGTTACASCDDLESITQVCQREGLWCHVDAAYAGSAFICEELTYFLRGVEVSRRNVDSYNFNPNKWMLINFDCSVLWVRDKEKLTSSMIVDPVYLQHKHSSLRRYIRNHCMLAKLFESQVKRDNRFELVGQVHFGLVCFRWKDSNALTQYLIRQINDSGKLHMIPATVKGQYIIRFALCSEHAKEEDVFYAWNVIKTHADEISTTIKTLNMWTKQAFRNSITKEVDIEQEEDVGDAGEGGDGGEESGSAGG